MSKTLKIPSYRHHKPSGRAVVSLGNQTVYLGKYGSADSKREYHRLIAEWTASNGIAPKATSDFTVAELLAAFVRYAKGYHTAEEQSNFGHAMRPLKELYGRKQVTEFGPLALKAVRGTMIDADLARATINQRINRIRNIFKWGTENELVPPDVLHGLQAVAGLRFGKTEARETEPVKPVPDMFVDEVIEYVSPVVGAMIELQRITGMRSGEVVIMRGTDIDTSGSVWVYTPAKHKTAYRGHKRKAYLGPKAQLIVKPYLKADVEAYLFSPQESMLKVFDARHQARKTPLSYGNRPGTNNRGIRASQLGKRYDTHSYRRAIEHGIAKANKARVKAATADGIDPKDVALIPHWHPHQLRHNAATALRREHGIEIARIILGHRSAAITEVYAEVDHARAIDVMAKIG